jgi:hypothetical protein
MHAGPAGDDCELISHDCNAGVSPSCSLIETLVSHQEALCGATRCRTKLKLEPNLTAGSRGLLAGPAMPGAT